MAEKNVVQPADNAEVMIAKAKDFWSRNGKVISIVFAVVIIGIAGFFIYKNFVQKPKEQKASDAIFKAEDYFRKDSFNLALNGDGQYLGFLKISDRYSGTDAGNLANFYAGVCYIRLDDNKNAIKYLKKCKTSSKPLQARIYKLLGDANGDSGNTADAIDYYKKAASTFPDDKESSADALFMAAYMTDRVLKNKKEAVALYKDLKERFPKSSKASDADNYLAQLGEYNVN